MSQNWAAYIREVLRNAPESARIPRLMSAIHPDAVGSYGAEAQLWAEHASLQPRQSDGTRWWQTLALERALEHDRDGVLCWPTVVVSAPRQVGKSWLERIVCGWRMRQMDRFGGQPQDILHVAHKLDAAQEVWRPAARAAKRDGSAVRWANGEQRIELPDGSRWMIQAANDGAGVAFSLSMALVDEAWRVARQVVDDAIQPTMAESVSPQTWLVSTAGTSESDLMLSYRAAAIAAMDAGAPGEVLLLEWSAPPLEDLDLDDVDVWRDSSPHWDQRRADAVRRARQTAEERAFRQQWLNQWVPAESRPLLEGARWEALATLEGPEPVLTFGVDVSPDRAYGIVAAYGGNAVVELAAVSPRAGDMEPPAGAGAAWIAPWLLERADAHGGRWLVGLDASGPAATIAAQLRGTALEHRVVPMSGRDTATASAGLYDRMTGYPAGVRLRVHPMLQAAVLGARWRTYGQARTFARDESGGTSGVPLVAAAAAVWSAERAPALESPGVF